jgi:hypothetical protein
LAPMPENRNRMLPGPPLRRLTRRRQNMASRPRNSSTRPGKIAPATVSAVQRASLFDAGAAAARQKLKMVGEVDFALGRFFNDFRQGATISVPLSHQSSPARVSHLSMISPKLGMQNFLHPYQNRFPLQQEWILASHVDRPRSAPWSQSVHSKKSSRWRAPRFLLLAPLEPPHLT